MRSLLATFRARAWAIGLVALVVRVAATWRWYQDLALGLDDNLYYHLQGRLFAEHLDIVDPFIWLDYDLVTPGAGHPPLYPTFLGVASVLGIDTPLGHRLVSCLIGALGVVLVAYAGRKVGGDRVGLIAAVLAAIYPNLWINDGLILSESMVTALVALIVIAAYAWRDEPTARRSIVLGASIGLGALARSEMLFLCVFMVLPLVLLTRSISFKRQLQLGVIVAVTVGALVAPWVLRNTLRFEDPATMSSASARVLAYGNCDETYSGQFLGYWHDACTLTEFPGDPPLRAARDAAAANPDDEQLQQAYDEAIEEYVATVDESVIDTAHREKASAYIEDHLADQPRVMAARVGRMWDVYRPFQGIDFNVFFERRGLWPSRGALAMYWAMLPFAVAGLVILRRRRETIVPFLGFAALITFTAASSFGVTRYRVPVDVCLTILAAVAFDQIWSRWRGGGTAKAEADAVDDEAGDAGETAEPAPV